MLVNRFALIAATLSCVSVCWATYPNLEAMLNNTPPSTVIAPNGVPLVVAVNSLPPHLRHAALQSLTPLADGSLLVASEGSMRQFYEAIDDRLRYIPKLCKDLKGFSAGDPLPQVDMTVPQPAGTVTKAPLPKATVLSPAPTTAGASSHKYAAINADPMHSPLNPTIHRIEPAVQKVLLETWANQPTVDKKAEASKKEADLAKKEADLAKKEADLAKKEADSAKEDKDKSKDSKDTADSKDTKSTTDHKDGSKKKQDDKSKLAGLPGDSDSASKSTSSSSKSKDDDVDAFRCNGVWAQLLGSSTDQKFRDDVLGYDSHLWGFIIGRDLILSPYTRAGAAIGYEQARTYSDVFSGSFFDAKRFQLSAYGRTDYLCCFYTQWALTGAFNRYDNKRKIWVDPSFDSTTISNIAHGIFTGWEYDVYLEEGFTWTHFDYQINPKIFLTYTHLTPEGYFEKDAFDLDLSVKYKDMDVLSLAGGFKFTYQAQFEKAFVVPEAHIYYFFNAINDKQFGTATFTRATYPFNVQGSTPEASSCEIGGALAVHSTKYVMIKLAYDVYWNRDYHRRQGYIQARYEWA